jgi:hypothetical protein
MLWRIYREIYVFISVSNNICFTFYDCDLFTDFPSYLSDFSTRERYYQLVPEKRWLQELQPLRASRYIRVCEYVYVATTYLVHIFIRYVLNRYCNSAPITGSMEASYG